MKNNSPIAKKKKSVKPLIFILIVFCVSIGYYAWRQQQNALVGLKALKSNGVPVTFSIISRPLLAVDVNHSQIYLINGHQASQPTRINFSDIKQITFRETNTPNNDHSEPTGPDRLIIVLNSGEKYRVGDLPGRDNGAKQAIALFQQHQILTDKLIMRYRDN